MLAFREELSDGLMTHITQELSTYTYTFITLAVAAIGFSINISLDLKLTWHQIPLLIAVGSWSLSLVFAFYGIQQKFVLFTHLLEVMDYTRKTSAKVHAEYDTEVKKKEAFEEAKTLWERAKKEAVGLETAIQKFERRIEYNKVCFVSGVVFFVGWWIIKLLVNTSA